MQTKTARRSSLAALALTFAACGGGGGGSTPTQPILAVISVAAAPSPAAGGPCANCGSLPGQREVVTQLTVRETAGVGVDLVAVDLQLRLDSAEILAGGSFDAGGIAFFAGSARLPAGGQLVLPDIGVHYPQARSGLAGTLTYGVRGTDDNGHQVSASVEVRVVT